MSKNVVNKMKQEKQDLSKLGIHTVASVFDMRESIAKEENDYVMIAQINLQRHIVQQYCERDNEDYFSYEGRLDKVIEFINYLTLEEN